MKTTEKRTAEELAEAYADSIDRRGCAFWQGMYRGYIAGHDKARNQAIQDCIEILTHSSHGYLADIVNKLESLKTKP